MAQKRKVITVIDSIEERRPDNDRGWGKYRAYLEGLEGVQKLDVPPDVNSEYDLQPGFKVSIVEGNYSWIVNGNSECFTGQAHEHFGDDISNGTGAVATTTTAAKTETVAPPAKKTYKRTPYNKDTQVEEPVNRPEKFAVPKSGNHSAWNQYQIDERDPLMRMQSLLGIVSNVHRTCIENNCDPSEVMSAIIEDVKVLDDAMYKYLGIPK